MLSISRLGLAVLLKSRLILTVLPISRLGLAVLLKSRLSLAVLSISRLDLTVLLKSRLNQGWALRSFPFGMLRSFPF